MHFWIGGGLVRGGKGVWSWLTCFGLLEGKELVCKKDANRFSAVLNTMMAHLFPMKKCTSKINKKLTGPCLQPGKSSYTNILAKLSSRSRHTLQLAPKHCRHEWLGDPATETQASKVLPPLGVAFVREKKIGRKSKNGPPESNG
ncbi:hypothetical protein QBC36DRAFT_328073 [Triangularia setosa]|uniref:LAGLIDADG homing endonuclease n=1 Tax=Triangularia setosa TaxID=2587417 RepID=A0AAN6W9I9_9PEZI|nr:hypothetical protein QBC36DRAFT_328073 [Podospora setosa]